MNLFEIPAQIEREKDEETWIVEKSTPAGRRIRYLVKGEQTALVYAASIGGVVIGTEGKEKTK